jgi:hypothetical protein
MSKAASTSRRTPASRRSIRRMRECVIAFLLGRSAIPWREDSIWFVATLHRFEDARETRSLLARILGTLQPP